MLPGYGNDWVFSMLPSARLLTKNLEILKGFTSKVIKERREEMEEHGDVEHFDDQGRSKKLAFLDLLLKASKDGANLSDEDIAEEVETFMFEGV